MSVEEKTELVKLRIPSLEKKLSEEQLDFILHPLDTPVSLKACPGSGKTEVVGIKAAYEIAEWKSRFSGIAILSFTKTAAKEITNRVKKFSGHYTHQHPHFIGTIDSWLHGYILHPHGHAVGGFAGSNGDKSYRLIDNEEKYDFLTNYKTVFSYPPNYSDAWVNEYYFECADQLTLQSHNISFSLAGKLPHQIKTLIDKKNEFLKAGFTTYSDAEYLCFDLLRRFPAILRNIVKRFPVLVIDECQDLSHNQLEILNLLCNAGAKIHFVGDNNQSIYEFKNVFIQKIDKFVSDNKLKGMSLTQNFRSNQKIVNIALELEGINTGTMPSPIVSNEEELLKDSCILWEYTLDNFKDLPQRFIDYINKLNAELPVDKPKIDFRKSGILSRGKSLLAEFRGERSSDLSKTELVANAIHAWENRMFSSKDMQMALQQLGKSICLLGYNGNGNHQNQYCPTSYDHIEWRQFLSYLIKEATNSTNQLYPFDDVKWSEWTGLLKKFLAKYWHHLKEPSNDFDSIKAKIRAKSGEGQNLVLDTFRKYVNPYTENIRMTTFHDVKGETMDAVLIISSKDKKSKGGHVEHWISPTEDEREYVRFAYVASSRPKHLLIWAILNKNGAYVKRINEMGFKSL